MVLGRPPHRSATSPCPDGDRHPCDGVGVKRHGRGLGAQPRRYSFPAVAASRGRPECPCRRHTLPCRRRQRWRPLSPFGVDCVRAAWVLACEAEPCVEGMLRGGGGDGVLIASLPGGVAVLEGILANEYMRGPSDALVSFVFV